MKTYLRQCKWGRYLLLRGDMICRYVDLYGEWCETEVALFRQLLRDGDNVVEVGANLGMHTVPLARSVGHGKVICFEPQRLIFQLLAANCALNELINVYAGNLAVGNENGTVSIAGCDYERSWNYGSFSLESGYDTEGSFTGPQWRELVGITRLDDHPQVAALRTLRLLKIDVEGMEIEVIRGAADTIAQHRPALFIENNNSRTGDELLRVVAELGYDSYWFCAERFRPGNFAGETAKLDGWDANIICFPTEQAVVPGPLMRARSFSDLAAGRVPMAHMDIAAAPDRT